MSLFHTETRQLFIHPSPWKTVTESYVVTFIDNDMAADYLATKGNHSTNSVDIGHAG